MRRSQAVILSIDLCEDLLAMNTPSGSKRWLRIAGDLGSDLIWDIGRRHFQRGGTWGDLRRGRIRELNVVRSVVMKHRLAVEDGKEGV